MNSNLILFAAGPDWLVSWATSLWILSVGIAAGLVALLLVWALMFVVARSRAKMVPSVLSEGALAGISIVMVACALFSVVGLFVVREPYRLLESTARLPLAGTRSFSTPIEANAEGVVVPLGLRGDEAVQLKMSSDEVVQVANSRDGEGGYGPPAEVGPTNAFDWTKREQMSLLFGGEYVENLYVTNMTDQPATLTIEVTTGPEYSEVMAAPVAAVAVMGLYLLYFVQAWVFPKVSAIALATTKSELGQPLFWILLLSGASLIALFVVLPYNTFGEDIKMLKDSGLTLVMILGIVQGVWAASNSVAEEIDGRTALTVLSKPVGRRQFILGKFAGILWTVGLLFVALGTWLVVWVAYKPVYDSREMGSGMPEWTVSHMEATYTVPGLVLGYFEATVLIALSVAISTRLPLLANFAICFVIYLLGHITPLIVQSDIQFAPVVFIGQLIATILPVLDHFNIQAGIAGGRWVPLEYLLWAFVYCSIYSGIALLLALALFEDRDLA